ncbi:MAG: hypothetical protein JWO71_3108 [Candidatus Acidoferrum typicum]|nr:hypothetical protein [Candidatus Acidoferrum typicum]
MVYSSDARQTRGESWLRHPSSQTFTAWGRDSYGNPNEFYGGQWSTGNFGTIASVDNGGNVTGVSPGSDGVNVELFGVELWQGQMCVSDNMTPNCNPQNVFINGGVTVNPTGFTISVSSTPVQGETTIRLRLYKL